MDIHPSSNDANVLSAVMGHIQTMVVDPVLDLPDKFNQKNIHWPGATFDTNTALYYLRVTLSESEGRAVAAVPDQLSTGDDDECAGFVKNWFVFLDLFVRRSCVEGRLWYMPRAQALMKSIFTKPGRLKIPVLDLHRTGFTSECVGTLKYMTKSPRLLKPDDAWLTYGLTVQLETVVVDGNV